MPFNFINMLVKTKAKEDHVEALTEAFDLFHQYNLKLNPKKCAFGVRLGKFLGYLVTQTGIEADPEKIKTVVDLEPPKTVKKG